MPVVLGPNDAALAFASNLQARGYGVRAIRPPTVPPGTARLRMSLTATLSQPLLADLVAALMSDPQRNGSLLTSDSNSPNDGMTAPRHGFFMTGTDTGVGKTVLSALLLCRRARCRLLEACYKPESN